MDDRSIEKESTNNDSYYDLEWYDFNLTLQKVDSAAVDDLFAAIDKKAYYKRFIQRALRQGIAIQTIATYLKKDANEITNIIDEMNH